MRTLGVPFLFLLIGSTTFGQMQPTNLTCERLTDPLGLDTPKPRFSWQLKSDQRDQVQTAYQIVVDGAWDSGRVESDQSLHVEYAGPAPKSGQRCTWTVRAWDQANNVTTSGPASFEMGLLDKSDWHGKWIARTAETKYEPAPLLRKPFKLRAKVKHARAFVCGLGYCELRLNGKKVGDHLLDPGYTRYDRRALYVTHDVTKHLNEGDNVVGAILGTGWHNVHSNAVWYFHNAPWRAAPKLLLELRVTYEDGTTETIISDGSWRTSTGPIVYDGIYGGESYDARLEQRGWDNVGFDDAKWEPAKVVDAPKGTLAAQVMPPIKVTGTFAPTSVTEPKPGVFVFDFGQNMAGITELTLKDAPAGTKITITHGERLAADGTLDIAKIVEHQREIPPHFQQSEYTASGAKTETWSPRFTYYGFQYAQITGFPGKPTADALKALVVHTAVEPAGEFSCSNQMFNRIQHATRWAYVSNLHSIPTDCPHREKNGWTGDAHLAAEQALFNFKPASVYAKWINDLGDEQRDDGALPGIVPTSGWGYDWGNGPAWDSALLLIPSYVHTYTGDERILTSHYDAFKRYVDYLTSRAPDGIVTFGLNDWVPYETATPGDITSTAYYHVDLLITAKTAKLHGKHDEAETYTKLAERVKGAFNAKFFDAKSNTYGNGGQTSLSCALYQGLVEPQHRAAVVQKLVEAVEKRGNHIDTGILGAKYVLLALLENGRADVAHRIVNQKTLPGWGHWIERGATTLWEDWKGEHSLNHIMFGDVSAWFYKAIAGIVPDPAAPGFKHFTIKPHVLGNLTHARATYDSVRGRIESAWKIEGNAVMLSVEIPANTRATVYVPTSDPGSVTESGKPIVAARTEDGFAVFTVGSGRYAFAARL